MKKLLFFTLIASILPCQLFGAQQELKKEVAEHVIAPGGPGSFVLGIPGLTTPINPKPDMKAIERAKKNREKSPDVNEIDNDLFIIMHEENQKDLPLQDDAVLTRIASLFDKGAIQRDDFIDLPIKLGVYGSIDGFTKLLNIWAKYGFNFDKNFSLMVYKILHYAHSAKENLENPRSFSKPKKYNSPAILVPLILKYVSNPNASDDNALHYIVMNPADFNDDLIQLLIDRGVDINIGGTRGSTPLHAAMAWGPESLDLLMKYNANPLLVNDNGETALQILDKKIRALHSTLQFQQEAQVKAKMEKWLKFRAELEKYTKEYRQKHTKEIQKATGCPWGPAGIVTECLIGEKTPQEKALQ